MSGFYLDDLVLQTVISHIDVLTRNRLELVSQRFGSLVRSVNSISKISLTIGQDNISQNDTIMKWFRVSIACGPSRGDWRMLIKSSVQLQENTGVQATVTTVAIRHFLQGLCQRYKRINCLTLQPSSPSSAWVRLAIDCLVEDVFPLESCKPTSIKQLKYSRGEYPDPLNDCYKMSPRDCCLVRMLAPLLKEFTLLDGALPDDGTFTSHRFLTAISDCTGLKKLSICSEPNLIITTDLQNCFKSLKIREFYANGILSKTSSPAMWLIESFKHNGNLRKLCVSPSRENIVQLLSAPKVLEEILRVSD